MWAGGVRVVVLDENKRVLMMRQRHENRDIWLLPGGGIEDGENSKQAAVREVKEETGLDIEVTSLLWHIEEVSNERGQRFVNFFLAEIKGGTLALGKDPEREDKEQVLEEARFMSREEINAIEIIYPEYIREELWQILSKAETGHDVFKIREYTRR
jgi:ADP-ribose pyrophosphatase YjhB (NUDIX family)